MTDVKDARSTGAAVTRTRETWTKVSEVSVPHQFTLGPNNAVALLKDPKHLGFTLARYKFATKMMRKCRHIIEIGCGEGLGPLMYVADTSATVTAIDFDESQIAYAREHVLPHTENRVEFLCQDLVADPYRGEPADGLVSLDVIEHIEPSEEEEFMRNCAAALKPDGIAVIGTPNEFAEQYASERSRVGHVNLFDPERLVSTLETSFRHVFLFSMNDEMVHTGYDKLAHYLMALCVK